MSANKPAENVDQVPPNKQGSTNSLRAVVDRLTKWTRGLPKRVAHWLQTRSDILVICYALLLLYALPLLIVTAVFFISDGFSRTSPSIEFSISIAVLYTADVRESLGTFIVPFITAYAIAGAQKERKIEPRTLWLFLALVALFLNSVFVYAAVDTRIDLMLGQTSIESDLAVQARNSLLSMTSSYVKELLVYISLLIGISQAGGKQ